VTQALVPHLYAAIRAGDLSPTGGLLSGDTVNLDATGEVRNGGTITAQNSLTAIAGRDLNEVSTTQSSAGKNVNLSAAQLVGAGNVAATAGNCPVLALIQEAAWMHWRSMRSPTRPRLPTILCRG
jgi:filamentous hemagglutinin